MRNLIFGSLFVVCACLMTTLDSSFADDPHHEQEDNCSTERIDGGVEICCESESDSDEYNDNSDDYDCFTIMDGEDGQDGTDGEDGGDGEDGLNCFDLNGNGDPDFCHPRLTRLFDGCPASEDFFLEYECEYPPSQTKAMTAAKSYDSECGAFVSCEEYIQSLVTDLSDEAIALICAFTEDINGDSEIDALDCNGDDGGDGQDGSNGSSGGNGSDGSDGADGTNGIDGLDGSDGTNGIDGIDGSDGSDGIDGVACIVIDNSDATCTIECDDSMVIVYNCGSGAKPEDEVVNSNACGAFGGLTIVAMLLPLGLMRSRSRRYRA